MKSAKPVWPFFAIMGIGLFGWTISSDLTAGEKGIATLMLVVMPFILYEFWKFRAEFFEALGGQPVARAFRAIRTILKDKE